MSTTNESSTSAPKTIDFDPIGVEVFTNRLLAITESMASDMMRSSFSPTIKERRDFSVGLFDAKGRLIAQGTHIPVHLGSLLGAVEAVLARYPLEEILEGDAYICNDPYAAAGTHLPDISVITPVFVDGTLVAFCANIGHHSDVGGPIPGSISAGARSIFEEGLRLPIIRIVRQHRVDDDLIALISLNSRLSEERGLDLRVQVATNESGAKAVRSLIARMGGVPAFVKAVDDMLTYTLCRVERRIADLKDEAYSFTTWLDDDGTGKGDRVPLKATVFKEHGRLVLDFSGSGSQSRGALNVARSALRATVYYCVKAMLDPELMANSGLAEAIEIRAPKGSIVAPAEPAACGARTIACQRIAGAIIGAFRNLVPRERLIASSCDTLPSIALSGVDPASGRFFLFNETLGGGSGATLEGDGMDAVHVHITNSQNLPSEVLEHEFPLRVERYGLAENSGGAGRTRGGMGIVREVRTLCDGLVFSARSDGHLQGAAGLEGGGDGGVGRLLRNAGTANEELLSSKVSNLPIAAGETIRIETPGGAGFGHPAERKIEHLRDDILDGVVSHEQAIAIYGAQRVNDALSLA